MYPNICNISKKSWHSKQINQSRLRLNEIVLFISVAANTVPHWSESCSGAWPGLRRWRKPCCSLHVHTRMASLRCGSAGGSSDFPGESRPYCSLQTTTGRCNIFRTTAKLRKENDFSSLNYKFQLNTSGISDVLLQMLNVALHAAASMPVPDECLHVWWTKHSQCTCVASPPCVFAYEPPAYTGLWKASVLESTPASDTQTPSFLRGCAHCWCAVHNKWEERQMSV